MEEQDVGGQAFMFFLEIRHGRSPSVKNGCLLLSQGRIVVDLIGHSLVTTFSEESFVMLKAGRWRPGFGRIGPVRVLSLISDLKRLPPAWRRQPLAGFNSLLIQASNWPLPRFSLFAPLIRHKSYQFCD